MKYVALLRGINVGGNNMIKMVELKEAFEKNGFTDVLTYINSGNVIFSSDEKKSEKLTLTLEEALSKTFNYKARVMVLSHEQIKQIVANVPHEWKTSSDIRCYVGFLADSVTDKAIKEVPVREGVDSLKVGQGVLYMTTLLSALSKSAFNKIMSKKIYQDMTIRNYNTTQKLLALMEQK
jgi:uncharacterized protein (DUF1697 family)